jgi:hypothetical protein
VVSPHRFDRIVFKQAGAAGLSYFRSAEVGGGVWGESFAEFATVEQWPRKSASIGEGQTIFLISDDVG